jgi:hypothetical protein
MEQDSILEELDDEVDEFDIISSNNGIKNFIGEESMESLPP